MFVISWVPSKPILKNFKNQYTSTTDVHFVSLNDSGQPTAYLLQQVPARIQVQVCDFVQWVWGMRVRCQQTAPAVIGS